MASLDPSRPYQIGDELLVLWLPRGGGRDASAQGLLAKIDVCGNPACSCTIATLQAHIIDDRAERALCEGDRLRVSWRPTSNGPARPECAVVLKVDFTTGVVVERGGGKLPAMVARFFEEPLPYWVLDQLWAHWRAHRGPSGIDWKAQASDLWEPGTLLSTFIVFPEERPDRYLVNNTVYQVDTLFCVAEGCSCTEARLAVLALTENGRRLEMIGSALLPLETMNPVGFDGPPRQLGTFVRIYSEWRRRNVPAEDRLSELRELTLQRGIELNRLAAARARPGAKSLPRAPARLAAAAPQPGRNAACPCGSGKKYKRCCGQ